MRRRGGDIRSPQRTGIVGLGLCVVSIGLVAGTAASGRSVAVPVRNGGFPPYAGSAHLSPATVTALLAAAAVTGGLGLLLEWLALRAGWRPSARRLALAGCVVALALCLLPHIGSADPESYAAYGREAAVGIDPYRGDPSALASRGDPYGDIVEAPWQHTPSVYGPLATLEQDAAARIAGGDPRRAVWLLDLAGALAFAVTTALLLLITEDVASRRRVAVLWAANPLLLWQLVAGGHIDTIEIMLAVAAVAAVRRSRLLAVALMGAAIVVKLPAALVAAGVAWTLRRSARAAAAFVVPTVAVVVGAYVAAGPHALDQARTSSRFVSRATPWRPLATLLDHAWGRSASREVIGACAVVLAAALAVLLIRTVGTAGRATVAAMLVLAYVLVTPYALPWYDGLAWALMVLLVAGPLDLVLLAHTTVLSLAYIPGRAVPLPPGVDGLTSALRDVVAPTALGVLGATAAVLAVRRSSRGAPGYG
ncbi:MAG: hypothetical protein ACJ735_05080 [Actinomycetes bacterium]